MDYKGRFSNHNIDSQKIFLSSFYIYQQTPKICRKHHV